jgi:hypothetical protein
VSYNQNISSASFVLDNVFSRFRRDQSRRRLHNRNISRNADLDLDMDVVRKFTVVHDAPESRLTPMSKSMSNNQSNRFMRE